MRILITGAKGQLGSALQDALRQGYTVLGALPESVAGAEVIGLDLPELDITDLAELRKHFQTARPDVVVHCAAMTHVDGCESDPDAAFRVNALGARNVALCCEEVEAKMIHISTDYVFAGDGTVPHSEWDLPNPQSAYGHSKRLGEQYVADFCRRHFIVRTSWLYGLRGRNFVKTLLCLARERGEVKVVDDQRGNPTNAEDLAHHLLLLADTGQYGIYHITGKGICSWYDFAAEFLRLSGMDCRTVACSSGEFASPTHRPAYSALEHRMLRATIGDHMRDWRDAIADYMAHYDKESGDFQT